MSNDLPLIGFDAFHSENGVIMTLVFSNDLRECLSRFETNGVM